MPGILNVHVTMPAPFIFHLRCSGGVGEWRCCCTEYTLACVLQAGAIASMYSAGVPCVFLAAFCSGDAIIPLQVHCSACVEAVIYILVGFLRVTCVPTCLLSDFMPSRCWRRCHALGCWVLPILPAACLLPGGVLLCWSDCACVTTFLF
jgi:hypothetical protein